MYVCTIGNTKPFTSSTYLTSIFTLLLTVLLRLCQLCLVCMSLCRIVHICGQRSQKYEEVRFICVPAFLRYSQEFISCVRDKFNCVRYCVELVILVFSRSLPLEHTFITTCQISHTSPEIYTYLPIKHNIFVNATRTTFTITSTAHYCKTKC